MRIEKKMRKSIGIKKSVRWVFGICILVVLTVACVVFARPVAQKAYVLLPPHQIAAKHKISLYMNRYEETLSFLASGDEWTRDKDKMIRSWKYLDAHKRPLEVEFGPLEIRENETFDKATRVVMPVLSEKWKDLSTGNVNVLPDHRLGDYLLVKQQTPEGQRWRIMDGFHPNYAEIEATWLKLPRKKVPGSPRIILKKAILMQVISDDGKIVGEKTILFDEKIENIGTFVENGTVVEK
jgi:hypothetical protein